MNEELEKHLVKERETKIDAIDKKNGIDTLVKDASSLDKLSKENSFKEKDKKVQSSKEKESIERNIKKTSPMSAKKQKVLSTGKEMATRGAMRLLSEDEDLEKISSAQNKTSEARFLKNKVNHFLTNQEKFSKVAKINQTESWRFLGKFSSTQAASTGGAGTATAASSAGAAGASSAGASAGGAAAGAGGGLTLGIGIVILIGFLIIGMLIFVLLGGGFAKTQADSTGGAPPVTGTALVNATALYNHLTKENKATPQGAAGALANAQRESNFDPKAVNAAGGVAGIFQWSGWSNTVNGSRILSEGSIRVGNVNTLTLDNELKLMDYELNGNYQKVEKEISSAKDSSKAADEWLVDYEGVSLSDPQGKVKDMEANAEAWMSYFTAGGTAAAKGSLKILESLVGQQVGSGECYALSAYYVDKISGFELEGEYASQIGSDNEVAFESHGWKVILNPKTSDLKVGAVVGWNTGSITSSIYGHTGVIYAISNGGKNFSTYEQNVSGKRVVGKYGRTWDSSMSFVAIPPDK